MQWEYSHIDAANTDIQITDGKTVADSSEKGAIRPQSPAFLDTSNSQN